MVEGTEGSHHKEGSTKMAKPITICAGIDTGKPQLLQALHPMTMTAASTSAPVTSRAAANGCAARFTLRRYRLPSAGIRTSSHSTNA